eukprot:scaffold5223_cov104-Isochrysis_galbana.AAC.2
MGMEMSSTLSMLNSTWHDTLVGRGGKFTTPPPIAQLSQTWSGSTCVERAIVGSFCRPCSGLARRELLLFCSMGGLHARSPQGATESAWRSDGAGPVPTVRTARLIPIPVGVSLIGASMVALGGRSRAMPSIC